jgi:hypothetical protein
MLRTQGPEPHGLSRKSSRCSRETGGIGKDAARRGVVLRGGGGEVLELTEELGIDLSKTASLIVDGERALKEAADGHLLFARMVWE